MVPPPEVLRLSELSPRFSPSCEFLNISKKQYFIIISKSFLPVHINILLRQQSFDHPNLHRPSHDLFSKFLCLGKCALNSLVHCTIKILLILPVGPLWRSSAPRCLREHPGMKGHPQCSRPTCHSRCSKYSTALLFCILAK